MFKSILLIGLIAILAQNCLSDSLFQNILKKEKQTLYDYIQTSLNSNRQSNVCCQIDPPSIPIFSQDGHLLYYQQQPCPEQHKVCCRGFINIVGYCIQLDQASAMLPTWQSLAQQLGISLGDAILQSGTLLG